MKAGEEYTKHMGQYPVIFLSLKSAKQPTYEMAYLSLVDEISYEFDRHRYILDSDNVPEELKEKYISVLKGKADSVTISKSIALLSKCLEKYHNQKPIILIDEYNVPLENAYFNGFYDQMVSFNVIMDIFLALQKPSTIEKPIHEDITYADIYKSQDNLLNSKYICQ